MELIKHTQSLCPEDLRVIDAGLFRSNGQVIMKKTCPDHGEFEDIYWSDYDEYMKAERFRASGTGLLQSRNAQLGCPLDCGLCENHQTHTILVIMEITQRCNLRCPICFAQAGENPSSPDLTLDQIRSILEYTQKNNYPLRVRGVGNSGGEPTLRDDLPEIIRLERELGFDYILIMTNGLRLADDIEYFKKIRDEAAWLYLQFDGVTSEPYMKARGRDLWPVKKRMIENARKIGYNKIALIPTLARGVNDHQVGDIIRFAADNSDVIKFLVFQPVSFSGRIDRTMLKDMRITNSDVMRLAEEQTGGQIRKSDFFTLPMNQTMAKMMTKGGQHQDFCVHPHCGLITVVDHSRGRLDPVPRYIKNEKFHAMMRRSFDLNKSRPMIMLDLILGLARYVSPRLWLKLARILLMTKGRKSIKSILTEWLPGQWLTIGIMHFMDPYNFDLDRVRNCALHFGVIDNESRPRLIPFCSMNSIHRSSLSDNMSELPVSRMKIAVTSGEKAK
ncbi:MAG: radical SAM protein [Dehalococcoidia bacterium]|nr:radical SAM protein [Dehalococcoidia bacterium]